MSWISNIVMVWSWPWVAPTVHIKPRLICIPLGTHVDNHHQWNLEWPSSVRIQSSLAFAELVQVIVRLEQCPLIQDESHVIHIVEHDVGMPICIMFGQRQSRGRFTLLNWVGFICMLSYTLSNQWTGRRQRRCGGFCAECLFMPASIMAQAHALSLKPRVLATSVCK